MSKKQLFKISVEEQIDDYDFLDKAQIEKEFSISAKTLERMFGLVPRYVSVNPSAYTTFYYNRREVADAVLMFCEKYGVSSRDVKLAMKNRTAIQQQEFYKRRKERKNACK